MGLISQWVRVKLQGVNIKYYEDKGYYIPRVQQKYGLCIPRGTTILVKTSDLNMGKNNVLIQCDNCGVMRTWYYSDYLKHNHDGKTYCKACANKIFLSGDKSPNWNPNLTSEEREYKRYIPGRLEFIKKVFQRDNYTCQHCKKKINHDGSVHHLNGWNWDKENRLNPENGVTLCNGCHKNFHFSYGYGNNTREQYIEWNNNLPPLTEGVKIELPESKKIIIHETQEIFNGVMECSRLKNLDASSIYLCCNHTPKKRTSTLSDGSKVVRTAMTYTVSNYHIFYLEEYKNLTEEELYIYLNKINGKCTDVVLANTGEYFRSIALAAKKYNVPASGISDCINSKQFSAYNLESHRMVWMKPEDYCTYSKEEINLIINKAYFGSKKVYKCIESNEYFVSMPAAAKYVNKNPASIAHAVERGSACGTLLDGQKAHWVKIEINDIPLDLQNKIIDNDILLSKGIFYYEKTQRKEIA